MTVSRRDFLKTAATATAAGALYPLGAAASDPDKSAKIIVVKGKDAAAMLEKGMEAMGGWSKFVKKGKQVTIKPNAAWNSKPEEGGNTAPDLVGAAVKECVKAGASKVVVPEKPCSSYKKAFDVSGIQAAVEKAGGTMYPVNKDELCKSVKLPDAKTLKKAKICKDVLETACLINMPVAKNHSGATLTLSMKNWMGSVSDRRFFHKEGLHQCIADCSTKIKPNLIIIDATRIMLTAGPRGPGKMAYPNEIILGTDPVAVDAYAATLFKMKPFDVKHIEMAHDMGIGCGDLDKIEIQRLEV